MVVVLAPPSFPLYPYPHPHTILFAQDVFPTLTPISRGSVVERRFSLPPWSSDGNGHEYVDVPVVIATRIRNNDKDCPAHVRDATGRLGPPAVDLQGSIGF